MYIRKVFLAVCFLLLTGSVIPQPAHAQSLIFSESTSEMTVGETRTVANAVESTADQPGVIVDDSVSPFEVVSPLAQTQLLNPDFRVVERLPEDKEEISDLTFLLLVGGVWLLVTVAVFLHRVKQMFFSEETTLFTEAVQLNP